LKEQNKRERIECEGSKEKKRKEKEKKKGMEKKGKLPLCGSKIIFKYFKNFFIYMGSN
jgi:hypothetical protein